MMAKGLTDDELKTLTDTEIRQAHGYFGGKLSEMRRKAEYYFLGEAKGDLSPPEIEGRSTYVDTTVRNTILWMKPTLIKTFCGSDNVVEFTPTVEGDEDKAKQATDYINYIFYKQNPGFQIINAWFDDALLQKVGILKVWWDDRKEETREEYRGLDDVALTQLMEDPEVQPIEHKAYPDEEAAKQKQQAMEQIAQRMQQAEQAAAQGDMQAQQQLPQMQEMAQQFEQAPIPMLHDVTFKRTKTGGRVRIENVPPEEFLISKKAKQQLSESPFCGHRLVRTASDLEAMGYKNVDQITSDDSAIMQSMERVERQEFDDEAPYLNQDNVSTDPSMRTIWITECSLKADVDGDGIAEWRKVTRAGNQILDNTESDGHPFVAICPIPLAHRFFGLSIADLGMEPQRQTTNLIRADLDNKYLQVNGRYFAVENQVNLDDLLTSRPGGVVRVKSPNAVGRLDQGVSDGGGTAEMVQYMKDDSENRTGWTRYSQGADSDTLNDTATGINVLTNKADARTELIERTFAETGFTDLFRMILKLVCQHQDKATVVKLGDKWTQIDPREWRNQFELSINVGLGSGNKDQRVKHLMMLHQQQGAGLQIGIATPENMYNSAAKLTEALGFKKPEEFWTDPSKQPPKPPAPDPALLKIQMEGQQAQAELQQKDASEQAQAQRDMQLAQFTQQVQAQQTMQQNQLEAQREALRYQHEAEQKDRDRQTQMQIEQYKTDRAAQSAERLAEINGEYQLLIAQLTTGQKAQQVVTEAHVELAQASAEHERSMTDLAIKQQQANKPEPGPANGT